MIDAFIRSLLGTFGNQVLDFLIANQIFFEVPLLTYALMVFLGRQAYQRANTALVNSLIQQLGEKLIRKNRAELKRILKRSEEIPWQVAMQAARFPLLSPPGSIRVYPRSQTRLEKLFTSDVLLDSIQKEAKTNHETAIGNRH